MIEDCRRHKLDLILVKSVSRFSRDTVDALETTRELKRLGIPVYFDLESINSFQPDFELYYSVYAAIAQSERESNHDNLAISIQHKIKDGTSKLYSRPCYGYKLDRNGEFVIVQEEAEVVKLVFNLYLDGLSILGIMRELEQRGITSPSGKAKWCRRSIDLMLENEKYRGNSVATAPTMSDARRICHVVAICCPCTTKESSRANSLMMCRRKRSVAAISNSMRTARTGRKSNTGQS